MANREPFVLPTVEEAAEGIGVPVLKWQGRCHEIAWAIRGKFDIDCRLCYGHWLGEVAEGSMFAERRGVGFQRHGWLELEDGRIIDPTRWVFEAVDPYIYFGPNDGKYDEGGDLLRQALDDQREIPGPDADPRKVPLCLPPEEQDARLFIVGIFGQRPEDLNLMQVGYLANLSRARLGAHAKPIFEAIVRAGQGAFIPHDNRLKVLGDPQRKKRKKT